jgi:hypothetical protein
MGDNIRRVFKKWVWVCRLGSHGSGEPSSGGVSWIWQWTSVFHKNSPMSFWLWISFIMSTSVGSIPQIKIPNSLNPLKKWCWYLHKAHTLTDSVDGIATRYGLEGPGIESRWGEIFCTYPDRLRGPPRLLYNGNRVFPGGKGGRGAMLTTHPLLVPRLRKSWATCIPPLTLWALLGLLRGSLLPTLTFTPRFTHTLTILRIISNPFPEQHQLADFCNGTKCFI